MRSGCRVKRVAWLSLVLIARCNSTSAAANVAGSRAVAAAAFVLAAVAVVVVVAAATVAFVLAVATSAAVIKHCPKARRVRPVLCHRR